MLKILSKFTVLFCLLLINIALFTWCIDQLELELPIQKTLNINVHANIVHYQAQQMTPVTLASTTQSQVNSAGIIPLSHKSQYQLVLQFQRTYQKIEQLERVKLENMLRSLNINTTHSVDIFLGTAHSKKNIPSPNSAKLRVQNIARIVYPYTQSVTMYYRPSMTDGKVIIEFSDKNPS